MLFNRQEPVNLATFSATFLSYRRIFMAMQFETLNEVLDFRRSPHLACTTTLIPRFESIGVYLPEKVVTTQELIDQMATAPQFDLEALTGIHTRRWRGQQEDSYTLARDAALKCLEKSQYQVSDLDMIVCCSITHFRGSFFQMIPSFSKNLKTDLGMRDTALNFDITNACAGMLTGVSIVSNMIKSGAIKTGLVISGECITPIAESAIREISEPIDPQFASLTVGDAGAACIIDGGGNESEGIYEVSLMCLPEFAELCIGQPSEQNAGVVMYTDAMSIHKEVIDRLPLYLSCLMESYGYSAEDIDFIIPHQTSARAIESAMELCLPLMQSSAGSGHEPEVLFSVGEFGNTASTSHFVVLYDKLKKGKIKPGSRILPIALASGIILGAMLITLGNLEVD